MHITGWLMLATCALIEVSHYGVCLGLIAGVMLIGSLLLHEVGHMLMASALGVKVAEFGIFLMGAYNRRDRGNSRRDEILISLAGPLMNFALLVPCFLLPRIGPEITLCNLLLGLFNLLPLPSTDGWRIMKTIFFPYPVMPATPATTQSEPVLRKAA
jgi:Zn-dependent protease